jgi:hypothetical protein
MTRTIYSTLFLTLVFAPLTACDTEADNLDTIDRASELDGSSEPIADVTLEASQNEPATIYNCEPTVEFEAPFALEDVPGEITLAMDPQAIPEDDPGPGCGTAWIIYGTWQNTSSCGVCGVGKRNQMKVDSWVNNCGVLYNVVHTRCNAC